MARVRSPNYPAISLKQAVEQADKIYKKEHTHKASREVVAKAMGYGGLNGASLTAISSLKKYGLLEEANDELKISRDALTILVDPKDSQDRAKAIVRAAFTPVLFDDLQTQYGRTPPSDENLRAFLLKRGFSQQAVDTPIRAYRETLELVSEAERIYSSIGSNKQRDTEAGHDGDAEYEDQVEVGDYIQWESGGVLQFDTGRRVRAIQSHEGSDWVFVEGSETGIPMSEVMIEQKGVGQPLKVPPTLPEAETATVKFGTTEREWLRGPLSKDFSYRLIVTGDLGPKEIGKLIKLLEAQREILSDDEES